VHDPEFSTRWALGALILHPVVRLLFRLRVEGIEHVPQEGPAILAFNHTSVLDGPVVAIETARRRRRPIRFLIAAEIVARGLAGWILRAFDQIPIRRGAQDEHAIDQALDTIAHGAVVALAPEGRMNEDDAHELLRIKSGVARLALPTGVPIVPIGVWGTNALWPKSGARWGRVLSRPRLAMVYGPPIVPHGSAEDPGDIDELRERVRGALEAQVARARAVAEAPA
jgi:1-acyl-sn-glycerol-3-phosphate acyltransferase